MTAQIRSLTVALDQDIRDDDIESLVSAIKMMRNVLCVTANEVSSNDWATEMRVKRELVEKLQAVTKELFNN